MARTAVASGRRVRRCRRPIVAAALLLALAGCTDEGGDGDAAAQEPSSAASPPPATPSTPAGDGPLTQEQAQSALLTLEDLPQGWQAGPPTEVSTDDVVVEPPECAAVVAAIGADAPAAAAEAAAGFTGGSLGPVLEHGVSSFEDGTAGPALDEVETAFEDCPQVRTADPDGPSLALDLQPVEASALGDHGDRTVAVRGTGDLGGVPVTFDLVLVAVGDDVASLLAGGLRPLDTAQLDELTATAADRLEAAQQG